MRSRSSPETASAGSNRFSTALAISPQLVQADCNRLSQIHRPVLFARGNTEQPMAMAHVVVREAKFFGAEQQRRRPVEDVHVLNRVAGGFQSMQRNMQIAIA